MAHPSIDLARQFVERKLVPWPAFEGALIVGSVAVGEARSDSDVDMILVFDPLDVRIVPGEFAWSPTDDEFYPIVGPNAVEAHEIGGVQIDAKRLAIDDLESPDLPAGLLHDLAHGLVLFDRSGRLAAVIERLLAYPRERQRTDAFRHREWAWISQAKAAQTS